MFGTTEQAAEKRPIAPHFACFVTGHDFSRAATALESTTGFSLCLGSIQRLLGIRAFFRSL
jgi:hypothetical protein